MKIEYRFHLEPGVVKTHDTDVSYKNCNVRNQTGMPPSEWADFTLKKFEQDKAKGYILDYKVIDPNSMSPHLSFIKKVNFTEMANDAKIGAAVDRYFERHGWGLYLVSNGKAEGYQVYFGKGVQVDNNFEWGFSCLFNAADVAAFAGNFFMDKVLKEDMNICPMCGSPIEPDDGEEDGYGELSLYWTCEKCGNTGAAIINTYDDNAFDRHEVD